VEATLATESYLVDTRQAVVWLRYGYSWPGASLREAAGVVVRYTAGYGAAEAVPARLRHAILMLVGHLYENREATSQAGALTATPMGVERLLWPYRVAF
ncbi:MAG: head-tail connector protein, partial [Ignavibacteriae bacterium]|nr:head-tail connector protein [Ignavibacteriota bacterium]